MFILFINIIYIYIFNFVYSTYNMSCGNLLKCGRRRSITDRNILLDCIGKRTAIDVFTTGSSYNNVDKVLCRYIA